ncbi:MAG TPA: (2Fe-2S) ferredoxin domain-containing protein [Anaeromyxobacteraceae bacterium]|nr:(2Fe-2S) ferredoxin domain-containing protein [Anaeromyxobacteraceae bacterium]
MEPFRLHVYSCQQEKSDPACCAARGSAAVLDALRKEIVAQGLANEVQVTTCGSLGLCGRGPNMVVYPEGVWYSAVQATDVAEIVREHFRGGVPVTRLLNTDASGVKREILENRAKAMAALAATPKGA